MCVAAEPSPQHGHGPPYVASSLERRPASPVVRTTARSPEPSPQHGPPSVASSLHASSHLLRPAPLPPRLSMEKEPKLVTLQDQQLHDPPAPTTPTLPPELVLEIVDRCDPATLIACAAACRVLRRHVLNPAFLHRRRAASSRFVPSSLLGLFYRHYKGERSDDLCVYDPVAGGAPAVIFTPDDDGSGAWGPAMDAFAPDNLMRCQVARPSSPVILGAEGVILHWLCTDSRCVLTLHADTAEVGTVALPPWHVLLPPYHCSPEQEQLLASTADGELSLLVTHGLVINVWVLRAGRWARCAAVDVERIVPVVGTMTTRLQRSMMQLEWAGEMSGAVVAQVAGVGLLVLDLEKEEVVCTVQRSSGGGVEEVMPFRYCPYECDLLLRLPAMAHL
ncbi:hypothetical protein HU200_018855 [Digitaria exilis]|uniref:F-box domain-containing protein n=1 Tax=Digitaria exilis TaxID=1010633 RepID=A0A835KG69_9POAL|nr:hypothetical protein HU200_018855 [Digitaria exilis]